MEFAKHDGMDAVFFDFDKYDLKEKERETLQKNAALLKGQNKNSIIEGNCDERGTIEYNIALGQKRAREVRDYYMKLGADGGKISTISYGKERPVCAEHAESCWFKNRRADTKLAAPAPAAPAEAQLGK